MTYFRNGEVDPIVIEIYRESSFARASFYPTGGQVDLTVIEIYRESSFVIRITYCRNEGVVLTVIEFYRKSSLAIATFYSTERQIDLTVTEIYRETSVVIRMTHFRHGEVDLIVKEIYRENSFAIATFYLNWKLSSGLPRNGLSGRYHWAPKLQGLQINPIQSNPIQDDWSNEVSTISFVYLYLPVVPQKAVAEVSMIGHCRRGELLWSMDGRANPLMDRKVVGVVLFGVVAMAVAVTSAGCSV